jgi:hypothetical protein
MCPRRIAPCQQLRCTTLRVTPQFVRRDVAPLVAAEWYHTRTGADSAVSAALYARYPDGVCTRKFTVSYVAASSAESNGFEHFTRPQPVAEVAALAAGARIDTTPLADA